MCGVGSQRRPGLLCLLCLLWVASFEKNLFLGESHQGWGQPSSVHLRKSILEHLGGIVLGAA